MAKPRVFISSTFYDLKQIRADLDNFILGLGYDVVRNEEGGIPYGTNFKLEDYCYKEVSMVVFDNEGGLMSSYPPSDDELVIKEKHVTTADDLPF